MCIRDRYQRRVHGEKGKIARLFSQMDTNSNNMVCYDEMYKVLQKNGVMISYHDTYELFQRMDVDKSGLVSRSEFMAATIDIQTIAKEESLRKAFQLIDSNKNGYITPKELLNAIECDWMTPDKVAALMSKIDQNQDNRISFDEFKLLIDDIPNSQKKKKLSLIHI
eukprot:TRINITY_DN17354_c0_g1_i4.p2 TRINITY_DN17354_c0_g1~~TRINITY_DN17354_c0_g1_i4.p2  ORF type:complete len:166 (-),score=31.52 TRINITY_DN17354_c0_g1_i4:181-678(-)